MAPQVTPTVLYSLEIPKIDHSCTKLTILHPCQVSTEWVPVWPRARQCSW